MGNRHIALSDRNGWIIDELGMPMGLGLEISELCVGASWTEENICKYIIVQ